MNTKPILVSGLVNIETTCAVRGFPIEYSPIDYRFFGVNMSVSGVGFNVAKALTALGSTVRLATLLGGDAAGDLALRELHSSGIDDALVSRGLRQTPSSAVLYDPDGKRKIYCDLKDIQETAYDFGGIDLTAYQAVVACNINFSRPLLSMAKAAGVPIATDVHALSDLHDDYNRDFMAHADILFLSDECVPGAPEDFIRTIEDTYHNRVIVMGCGAKGAVMYLRDGDVFYHQPAAKVGEVVNTVGAGDALFSAFVSLWCEGLPPVECLTLAQTFAAAKITHNGGGSGFLTRDELGTI